MKKAVKKISVIIVLMIAIASLFACNRAEQYFVLGTFLNVEASGTGCSAVPDKVYDFALDIETLLSPTIEGSDIYNVNHANTGVPVKCDEKTMEIASVAEYVYKQSNGAYDPSVYPLVRFYNMSGDLYKYAVVYEDLDFEKLPSVLALVGLNKAFTFDYENNTITKLIDGAMLDFGGIAKGYAVDKAREGIDCKMLVNLGGNISAKAKTYSIGIANPDRIDRAQSTTPYFGKISLGDGECVATSGDYQRYYAVQLGENQRKVYHHIINPVTGYCADEGIVSCSIVSQNGALGDAVATAVVILGEEEGVKLIETLGLKGVIIFDDLTYRCVGDLQFELR